GYFRLRTLIRMAFYLSKERDEDVVNSYRRYQQYLREHQKEFPRGAFELGTAEWYQNPSDHRCPHDGWLDTFTISEAADTNPTRVTTMNIRLLGAYHDGYVEFSYPHIFKYSLLGSVSARGVGSWLYDEFRVSPEGHLIHEIEWSLFPQREDARWIIEASDVEF